MGPLRPPRPKLVPPLLQLLLLVTALLSAMARFADGNTDPLPTTGPSPYLIAPAPPNDTQSAGDLSSSQPYWRDPNQVALPFPPPGVAERPEPRQGVSPPVGQNGTEPSPSSPSAPPSNGTSPGGNDKAAPQRNAITRGAQLLLPAAEDPRLKADPFAALALGVAGALLPPVLAAKAAEVANAAAAKVFAKKSSKKRKKLGKFCPLSPVDRDLLRTATGAALGAGAAALAESATPLELSRCALTLRETRPAAFQWVLFSGGRVNPCSIVLGQVSQAITEAIVEGKCYVPPGSNAATSAAAVGS